MPEVNCNDHWVVYGTEKLDGANVGIYIPREGEISCFSRNGLNADGLFNFKKDKEQLKPLINSVRRWLAGHAFSYVYLWGEYFGSEVNRRIPYNDCGRFKFYSHQNNDMDFWLENGTDELPQVWPYYTFERFTKALDLSPEERDYFFLYGTEKIIPVDCEDVSALIKKLFPVPFKSSFADGDAEGWVIELASKKHVLDRHVWKIKDARFEEKSHVPRISVEDSPEVLRLNRAFREYLTLNRCISVLSKTPERKRLDVLTKELLADAQEDFESEHKEELAVLSPKQLRCIYRVGSYAFLLMKQAIQEGGKK